MTQDEIYNKALHSFSEAVESYKQACAALQQRKVGEQAVSTALNNVISLGWRLKDAALLNEPAPLKVQRATKKER